MTAKPLPPCKAVLFDLGKVLFDFSWQNAILNLKQNAIENPEGLKSFLENEGVLLAYESGLISTDQFFKRIEDWLAVDLPRQILWNSFCDIFSPLQSNINAALKTSDHVPVGIVSNTNEAHIDYLHSCYPFLEKFPNKVYSFEVKAVKPDAEIFSIALEKVGVASESVLFIDDLEENLQGAEALGLQTLHCTPDIDLGLEIEKRLA